MSGIDPVTSDLYFSCSNFEYDEQMNDKLITDLKDGFAKRHFVFITIFIIIKFLLPSISVTTNYYVITCTHEFYFKRFLVLYNYSLTCCVLLY